MTLLPKGADLDWVSIWNKQTLYPALATELLRLAYFTHRYLEKKADGGLVRSLSRLVGTWNDFKAVEFSLSDAFINSLISKEETKATEKAAKRAHKFNSKIDDFGNMRDSFAIVYFYLAGLERRRNLVLGYLDVNLVADDVLSALDRF